MYRVYPFRLIMGAGLDGYIQLNIYGTTVENVQNNLGIFEILENAGLRFVVLEFPSVYDGEEPQRDYDEKFIDRDKERTVSHVNEQLDNTAHSDILSTAVRSNIKESIHNSISNQSSPEEQLCGDGYMNWINPSSSCGIDDMDVNELSGIYDSSSLINTYSGHLDMYSNSMNVLMSSMNSFFEKCDIDKCKNISHLNAEEADVDIRSLLADLVDDVSKATENQDSNQEMDDAVSFVSASGLEYYDDNLEEYHDSRYNVSEALHRLERSLSPAIFDINTSNAATEAVDIHGNCSADFLSRRAEGQISEGGGLDYYDDNLEEYHDSQYNVSEALHRLERSLSPAIFDINTSNAATEAVDIHGNCSADFLSRRAEGQISEGGGLDYYDDNLEEYHDSRYNVSEALDRPERSLPPAVFDTNSSTSATEAVDIHGNCSADFLSRRVEEQVLEGDTLPNYTANFSSSIQTRDESMNLTSSDQRVPSLHEEEGEQNTEKFMRKISTRVSQCLMQSAFRRKIMQCNFPHCGIELFQGCGKSLAIGRDRRRSCRSSRLFTHAETHADRLFSCSYCDFRGVSIRSLSGHHGRKHHGTMLVDTNHSREEHHRIFAICFPDLV